MSHNSGLVKEEDFENKRKRLWKFTIGDIKLASKQGNELTASVLSMPNDEIDEYERFKLTVDKLSIIYIWSISKEGEGFYSVKDLCIKLEIGIKNAERAAILKGEHEHAVHAPDVLVTASFKNLDVKITPDVYNGLVNLKEVLALSDERDQLT